MGHIMMSNGNWTSFDYIIDILLFCPKQKERKLLENKRLDLDACKNKLRKAKTMEGQKAVSDIVYYQCLKRPNYIEQSVGWEWGHSQQCIGGLGYFGMLWIFWTWNPFIQLTPSSTEFDDKRWPFLLRWFFLRRNWTYIYFSSSRWNIFMCFLAVIFVNFILLHMWNLWDCSR